MARDIPSLNAIRFFECAARHLSFTRAGEELFVTQSAVSRQIKLLEEQLDCQLFVRSGPNLKLTSHGEEFLQTVVDALDIIRGGTGKLRRSNVSTLTVSLLPSFAAGWLVPRFPLLHEMEPGLSLELDSSFNVVDFAQRTDIDVAIRLGRGNWPELYVAQLTQDRLLPACSPALAAKVKSFEDLLQTTLLIDDHFYDEWANWFATAGVAYKPLKPKRYNDTVTQIQAALHGQGVTLAREELISSHLASGDLVTLFDVEYYSEFHYFFVCPQARMQEEKIRCFHDWLLHMVNNPQLSVPA